MWFCFSGQITVVGMMGRQPHRSHTPTHAYRQHTVDCHFRAAYKMINVNSCDANKKKGSDTVFVF